MANLEEALVKISLFSGVPRAALKSVATHAELLELRPGQSLFYEGDDSDSMFVVKSGTVVVKKSSSEGEEDLAKIGSGSHLGEMTFLHSSAPGSYEKRTATAEAVEECTLIRIPFASLESAVESDPVFGTYFFKMLAQNLSARIQKTDEDLVSLKSLRLRHV
ncbi:cyclic nucleotide-binding domain-containing protein [bacterium]|nr:cyclic nucleotide-binding domain-containing protein [bacterium]